jgi:DNA-binding MarR family transcriptional regulator
MRRLQHHGHHHRLEARGLIERRPDVQDRRSKRVALTDAGRRVRRQLEARLAGDRPLVAGLS